MKRSTRSNLYSALVLVGGLITLAGGSPLLAQAGPPEERNYDARIERNRSMNLAAAAQQVPAMETMRGEMPSISMTLDRTTGAVRSLYNRVGPMQAAEPDVPPPASARAFIDQHLDLLGLTARDVRGARAETLTTAAMGTTRIYLTQTHLGLPVYNGQLQVNMGRDGSIVSLNNGFLPDLAGAVNSNQPKISAQEAIAAAFEHLGGVEGEAGEARLQWLPIRRGEARLVWNFQIETADSRHHYDFTVDAASGQVWTRFDWVAADDYRVYQAPVESPIHTLPGSPLDGRTLQIDPEHPVSQNGWFDAGVTIMDGNNVHACLDTDANNVCDAGEPNCAPGLSCDFPINLNLGPAAYQAAAVTNLFYWNNYIHDTQYLYGFDEASGNFQENNFGLGGIGSDSVNADAQNGSGNCNAFFATPPDGSNPRMTMLTCNNTAPVRDGDFDNLVIVHEYTHGISNRLVGGPNNVSCLSNTQQMGEGWSDVFGLIYTHQGGASDTDPRGVGAYLFGLPPVGGTIRTFPYSTDFAVNPDTYSTIGGRSVPHGVGSVWAQTVWEAYWELVNLRGFDPDLQNVAVNAGNHRMMRYLTEGMKNTACSPTFLDARDGIIVAAITHGLEDVCPLWRAFARRGLGTDATTAGPNSLVATDGFAIPPLCEVPPSQIQIPGSPDLGEVCVGSSATAVLDVCNSGPGELSVDPITSSDPQFSVTTPSGGYPLLVGPGDCFPFQVNFTPASTGPQSATLSIPSNDPGSPTLVAVSGQGTEQDIQVTGSTDFGVPSAWSPAERTVTVCNLGDCDLSVTGATVGCADFSLVANPFPATLPSGSCLDLVVGFTPVLPGPKSCPLNITSDDPDSPLITRTLTARTPPAFSLHAGFVDAHSPLSAIVDDGSTLNVDFVHWWSPQFAWDVRLGLSHFDGLFGLPDIEVTTLSSNVRFTLNPAAPVRVFVNAGPGLYHFDPGTFEGGLNGGLGLNVPVGPRFSFEATYNYHFVFTSTPDLEYSQYQLGFLVSF